MENLTEGDMYKCKKCHVMLAVVGGYSTEGIRLDPKPVWHYCIADHDDIGIHLGDNGKITLDSNYNSREG